MSALPVTPAGPMIRESWRQLVRDKSYQASPVGRAVRRFLSEYASRSTRESYENVLHLLARDHDDFESLERFCAPDGPELLREFLTRHWAEAAQATQDHRRKVVRAFFKWAHEDMRLIPWNPAATLRMRGRRGGTIRRAYPAELRRRLIYAQPALRDQCALGLLVHLGLRKNDLRELRIRDVDLTRNLISLLHGKGGEEAILPIEQPELREDLYLHIQGDGRQPREYLLYPKRAKTKPMDPASLHRWFKRCLENADLPPSIVMHELRHSAADELWRTTGNIVLAKKLLRHTSVGTTEAYLHPTEEDLRAGLRVVAKAWAED